MIQKMQYAANKKRYVTLKKWNKCTKINKEGQQGNEEWGMKCQIMAPVVKDKWEEVKQEGPQWALPGSQSLTFPIWSPSLKSWQLPEAPWLISWWSLLLILLCFCSDHSLSLMRFCIQTLYINLYPTLFYSNGPRRTAVYVIRNDKKSFHCTYT